MIGHSLGIESRIKSRIKKFTPHCVCILCLQANDDMQTHIMELSNELDEVLRTWPYHTNTMPLWPY